MKEVTLTYFKRSGKYYTEETIPAPVEYTFQMPQWVEERLNNLQLPGLVTGAWGGPILIQGEFPILANLDRNDLKGTTTEYRTIICYKSGAYLIGGWTPDLDSCVRDSNPYECSRDQRQFEHLMESIESVVIERREVTEPESVPLDRVGLEDV